MTDDDNDNVVRMEDYFRNREENLWQEANLMFGQLSEYERHLVRDAAVMGYVLGAQAGPYISSGQKSFPPDADIIRDVLLGCERNQDLYKHIGKLLEDEEEDCEE